MTQAIMYGVDLYGVSPNFTQSLAGNFVCGQLGGKKKKFQGFIVYMYCQNLY